MVVPSPCLPSEQGRRLAAGSAEAGGDDNMGERNGSSEDIVYIYFTYDIIYIMIIYYMKYIVYYIVDDGNMGEMNDSDEEDNIIKLRAIEKPW